MRKSFKAKPRTAVVLVRIGRSRRARVRPDGAAGDRLHPAAGDRGDAARASWRRRAANAYGEDDVAGAEAAAVKVLGSGPTANLGSTSARHDLAPWLVVAAVIPLAIVLRSRNL